MYVFFFFNWVLCQVCSSQFSIVWDMRKVLNMLWHITVFVCPEVTLLAWKNVKIQLPQLTQLSTTAHIEELILVEILPETKLCKHPNAHFPWTLSVYSALLKMHFCNRQSFWFFPVPLCWGCSKAFVFTLFPAFRDSRASQDWALGLTAGSSVLV